MDPEEPTDDPDSTWFHREFGGQVPDPGDRKEEHTASGRWTRCDGCGTYLRTEDLEAGARVCPGCGEHHQIDGMERLALIVDPGSFVELDADVGSADPLSFADSQPYPDRLASAIRRTGHASAFVSGRAALCGRPILAGTFLFSFLGGSMGSADGEKVTRIFERGTDERLPVICVSASGGARMQEGVLSLMQMARTTAALGRMRAAGVPFVSILTHPTTGGVAASFAMLGDLILAEPKALIGFAGPRVIEQTIRQVLPDGFQRSEYLLEHGMLDRIVDRRELRPVLHTLLSLLLD